MTTWSEQWKAEGLVQGRAEGRTEGRAEGRIEGRIQGQVWMLVSMSRQRFGEAAASTIAASLESVTSEEALQEIGMCLLTCPNSDALIAKIRAI